eukprot:jgi/Chrzof1/702/Cz01g25120.t1
MVSQAAQAVEAAWRAGVKRQRLEVLLPLIGATDLDDWPGGIRQQFKAALPLIEGLLKQLKKVEGLQGPLNAEIWDQGDAVGAWYGDKLGAVLFPTASTLNKLRDLADGSQQPGVLLIVNPQWELKGNVINDFGFGQRKDRALQFIDTFEHTYYVKQQRVYGDDLRVLRAFPGKWHVYAVNAAGTPQLLSSTDQLPSYKNIEAILRAWPESNTNKSWLDRLKGEYDFNKNTLQ